MYERAFTTIRLAILLFQATSHLGVASAFTFAPSRRYSLSRWSSLGAVATNAGGSGGFSVKSSVLESGLTEEERTVVRVFRDCGPSVAYVASFVDVGGGRRRRRPRRGGGARATNDPPGTSLGSGSGFVVESDGYVVTNYHVVQRAYDLNERAARVWNATRTIGLPFGNETPPARVYARVNSSTRYVRADVVGVEPELDVAVLRLRDYDDDRNSTGTTTKTTTTTEEYVPLAYGSSSELLVGQRVVAIGNPFGLDQTVTSGVVSALNRKVNGVAGNDIPNCIQTDAAINPGNSGGPLLNSRGELVGVNTAIVSTSGSNAGIGFAVPVDAVRRVADDLVEADRRGRSSGKRARGRAGLSLASDALAARLRGDGNVAAVVVGVAPGSAAEEAGVRAARVEGGTVMDRGDAIVAVDGRTVTEGVDKVREDFAKRRVGERATLTVEGSDGERRVVYLTLK